MIFSAHFVFNRELASEGLRAVRVVRFALPAFGLDRVSSYNRMRIAWWQRVEEGVVVRRLRFEIPTSSLEHCLLIEQGKGSGVTWRGVAMALQIANGGGG